MLLASRLPEDTVDVPGVGKVTVRGLSRKEVGTAITAARSEDGELDSDTLEIAYLAMAMVDPTFTQEEADLWHSTAGMAQIQPVIDKISELSGLGRAAAKSDV